MGRILRLVGALALLAVGAGGGAAADAVTWPDTPAGRRAAAFFPAFNSGDKAKARTFIADNYAAAALKQRPADERADAYLEIRADTGALEPRKLVEATATALTVLAEAQGGQWYRLSFDFEPKPPHGLVGVGFRPTAPTAADTPSGKLSDAQIVAALGATLDKLVAADRFSGSVLLAKGDTPLFHQAYGFASLRYRVPNRPDTKFNLGSMNKMFTAVAVAQLAEQGKLTFDDTVGKLLPDYPNKAVAEKVTVHHLLTHTSGLNHYWNEKFNARLATLRTVGDFLPLFADDPPLFAPGERFHYSNAGFIVLGLIVEKVSGRSYYDYVREHLCKSAGMTDTDCYETDAVVPNLAIGHTAAQPGGRRGGGPRRENLYVHAVKGGPAGGGYSTAPDLLRFATALRSHKLLSPKSTELVTTGKVATGPDGKYAYGFGDFRVAGHRQIGHSGGAPGINASLRIYPDLGYTAVVMSNYDHPAALLVADRIEELLTQK